MAKYVYPAIFTQEDDGLFSICFPDVEGCYTSGDDLEDSIEMAEDVLALVLYDYEISEREIPVPSILQSFTLDSNQFINYIRCDTMEYRKMYASKAVKKTLTIPEWLNEEATRKEMNFSQVLQEALIHKLQG